MARMAWDGRLYQPTGYMVKKVFGVTKVRKVFRNQDGEEGYQLVRWQARSWSSEMVKIGSMAIITEFS